MGDKPRVYLAGKIAKNDWRSDIRRARLFEDEVFPFPAIESEDGLAVITGPFFISCDHGCTHGKSTHAFQGGCADYFENPRAAAARACWIALKGSDLIYAWLDCSTAYGTIIEIGYAVGAGKKVIVATPTCTRDSFTASDEKPCTCPRHGDTWFATYFPSVEHRYADDAVSGYRKAIADWYADHVTFDSPVEKQFWDVAQLLALHELNGLTPQHQVGKYRIDFAIPQKKFGIEVDGLAYHNGQDSFIADRRRQRDLEAQGWRIIRFAAKEVMDDATTCVKQAGQIAGTS